MSLSYPTLVLQYNKAFCCELSRRFKRGEFKELPLKILFPPLMRSIANVEPKAHVTDIS
jgi:hypothetical protein